MFHHRIGYVKVRMDSNPPYAHGTDTELPYRLKKRKRNIACRQFGSLWHRCAYKDYQEDL